MLVCIGRTGDSEVSLCFVASLKVGRKGSVTWTDKAIAASIGFRWAVLSRRPRIWESRQSAIDTLQFSGKSCEERELARRIGLNIGFGIWTRACVKGRRNPSHQLRNQIVEGLRTLQ